MVKTVLAQLKQYKKDAVLTPLFTVLEVVLEVLIPYMTASIIDDGIEVGNIEHVCLYGGIMVVMAAFSMLFGVLSGRYSARAMSGLGCNLRESMFAKVQEYSFANIDKFSTAGLVTRMTTDVTNVQNAFQMILRMCTRAPSMMIFAMIMALSINAELSSVFFVAIVFLAIFLGAIVVRTTRVFNVVFQRYDDLNASVQENISAIRVVKAYVREEHEDQKFSKAANNLYKMFVKAEKWLALNNPIMTLAVNGCIILISWFGAQIIVNSGATALTTGNLTSMLSYVMNILISLMMLSMVFVMITMSAASVRRISEVLNEKSDITAPDNALETVGDGSIDFNDVSFAYKGGTGEPVLKDINLHIHSGETIGIIGGTGSAKSSLVSLISRLYDVTEGSVCVGGHDVRAYDPEALREQVSVVLQKNVLFSGTILDNLRWGDPNATEEECIAACRAACADEFIEQMPNGYETYIERGGTNVSGGQKQRLCIARALLKKPKILILDDSTSAVDTATDAKIRSALRTAIPGTTKLIIAQRISSVQDADRIIVMDDGKINGFGTHEQLLESNEIYREVYESQSSGQGDFDEKGGER